MKAITTLVFLLIAITAFAQESPSDSKSNSRQSLDNMPIMKGHKNTLDMPIRNGKGGSVPMPNRPTPAPMTSGEYSTMVSEAMEGQLDCWVTDSSNRKKSDTIFPKKKKVND